MRSLLHPEGTERQTHPFESLLVNKGYPTPEPFLLPSSTTDTRSLGWISFSFLQITFTLRSFTLLQIEFTSYTLLLTPTKNYSYLLAQAQPAIALGYLIIHAHPFLFIDEMLNNSR